MPLATKEPQYFDDVERSVDAVLSLVGREVVLGLPLGLGKANLFANAMFARAAQDRSIRLRIFTALTLEVPRPHSELERRFLEPFVERVFGDYSELAYAGALRRGNLPDNIEVSEFFLLTGAWPSNDQAQQSYVSSNYTHASRDLLAAGCNVIAQLVGRRGRGDGAQYSLSCNPEMTLDLLPALRERAARGGRRVAMVGEVNETLPFMLGDAEVAPDFFDVLYDPGKPYSTLFSLPHQPVGIADYAIGLHAASLVEDGGTLQIGIGSLSDAVARCLIVRHQSPDQYAALLDATPIQHPELTRERGPFEQGLYGCSEMVVDGFLYLIDAGVLKRRVFPAPEMEERKLGGESVPGGVLVHGGFFLGSRAMYDRLRLMSDEERASIAMTRISFVNQLYGQEELKRRQRRKARFINTAMIMTLCGAATSDGLEDGRVISGVGGQYNLVAMAHELEDARSLLLVRSTRKQGSDVTSNFRWSYGNCTIPRHLRDIVVSEYGVADLRGKTDRQCILALLNIADSRFQDELLADAKKAGKVRAEDTIPEQWRHNTAARLEASFGAATRGELMPRFPFGTDLTDEELVLGEALQWLENRTQTRAGAARTALSALVSPVDGDEPMTEQLLSRMKLDRPADAKERLYRRLVAYAITKTRA